MKKIALSAIALFAVAAVSLAGSLHQFKAGDISFSVLDKDAVSPVASASIKLISSESGDVVAEATADELGQAVLALEAGRYLLNISDLNLAVFDVSSVEGISACRVIMPDEALLVGGADQDDAAVGGGGAAGAAAGGTFLGSSVIWPIAGGVAIIGATVAAGIAIAEHNDDDDGDSNKNDKAVNDTNQSTTKKTAKKSEKKKTDSKKSSSTAPVQREEQPTPTPTPSDV